MTCSMKRILTLAIAVLSTCSPAVATLYTYNFGVGVTISDALDDTHPGEFSDTRTISGISVNSETGIGFINDVNVTVNISGGFNGDLYGYLIHDSGFAILLNRVGRTGSDSFGYSDPGFSSVRLDDSAVNGDIHLYSPHNTTSALTGT